jgi:hypothetical protein
MNTLKRYGKKHLTIEKLGDLLKSPPKNAKVNVMGRDATPAMPDECKVPGDVVQSYSKLLHYEKKKVCNLACTKSNARMV